MYGLTNRAGTAGHGAGGRLPDIYDLASWLVFDRAGNLSPLITSGRTTAGTFFDATGTLQTAAANVPRVSFDSANLAGPKFVMAEETRINLFAASNDFSNAAWLQGDATVQVNTTVSISGVQDADTVTIGATNSTVPAQLVNLTASAVHSISVYFHESSTAAFLRIRVSLASGSVSAFLNTATKAFATKQAGFSGGVVSSLPNGWYRAEIQFTPSSGDGGARYVAFSGVIADLSGTPDAGKTLVMDRAQAEMGATASSYIPTTTAPVTRTADNLLVTDLAATGFNQAEGTIYSDAIGENVALGASRRHIEISDGSTNNRYVTGYAPTSQSRGLIITNNVFVSNLSTAVNAGNRLKVAFAFSAAGSTLSATGGGISSAPAAPLPSVSLMKLGTDTFGTTGAHLQGRIYQAGIIPRRLPHATIQRLIR